MSEDGPKKIDPKYPSGGGGLGVGHDAAIGVLGAAANLALPLSGPVVQALIKKCVQAPLEVRRGVWFNEIGEGLRELQDRFEGFDPEKLAENEDFASAVYETTHIAMRTSKEEKREALCNAVLNIAMGIKLDDVLHGSFISLIDRFSATHIMALRIYDGPQTMSSMVGPNAQLNGNVKHLVSKYMKTKGIPEDVSAKVNDDLEQEKMIATTYQVTVGQGTQQGSVLMPIGKSFLQFISKPIP